MTEFCRRMLNEDETDSPETCRERRRRRIEMRRVAAAASASASASRPPPAEDLGLRTGEAVASSSSNGDDASERFDPTALSVEPTFATLSVAGRCRYMEDMVTVRTAIATPEIACRMPVHFFAVYDGHGGSQVSELCKERMNMIVAEEMGRLRFARGEEAEEREREREEDQEEWWWRRVMKRSFARMDYEALSNSPDGIEDFVVGGSTAAIAILTPKQIVVANVGDSRAVLCRRGLAVPLSIDHKPNRSDELARIEAAGGHVIFSNGARVEGILAMSRAIGDKYLKQYVISEPEITITKRGSEDECLIIASDGLWDVLSSDTACRVAAECISSGDGAVEALDRITLVAAILTRLALGRRSSDNISVIVVDLRRS